VREKETTEAGDSDDSVGAQPQQRDSGVTTEVNAVVVAVAEAVAPATRRALDSGVTTEVNAVVVAVAEAMAPATKRALDVEIMVQSWRNYGRQGPVFSPIYRLESHASARLGNTV